eukprot:Clim_evm66s225 gene=Clim_evmTU66s225
MPTVKALQWQARHKPLTVGGTYTLSPRCAAMVPSARPCTGTKRAPSSLLEAGTKFIGVQSCEIDRSGREEWHVKTEILSVDPETGLISGTMEACNVPRMSKAVRTFWEGEIIQDWEGFYTRNFGAERADDHAYWSKLKGWKQYFRKKMKHPESVKVDMDNCPYIYMRWKEKYFVDCHEECNLTIAGFYYICFHRRTGQITGYYFDKQSTPFQLLVMRPDIQRGYQSATYSFA